MIRDHLAPTLGLLSASLLASSAHAWEFRCRFVERLGNVDVVLPDNTIDAADLAPRRIRVQFGVFDDADSPAPAGGYVGWNVGTLAVSGPADNSDETRTPGRLTPFSFGPGPNANGNPPIPSGDPFTMLTDIDNTLGIQSPEWICRIYLGQVLPGPQPSATIRGLNSFVSTYEFTIDPRPGATTYTVSLAGNVIAATEWLLVGNPNPPDCGDPEDPSDDIPGSITYAPFPTPPQAIAAALTVNVPGPGAGLVLALSALAARRRR